MYSLQYHCSLKFTQNLSINFISLCYILLLTSPEQLREHLQRNFIWQNSSSKPEASGKGAMQGAYQACVVFYSNSPPSSHFLNILGTSSKLIRCLFLLPFWIHYLRMRKISQRVQLGLTNFPLNMLQEKQFNGMKSWDKMLTFVNW